MTTIIDTRATGNGTRGPLPGANAPRDSLAIARNAWGDEMEDWVIVLAKACDRSSQSVVAKRLRYSGSVVSSVINRNYKGSYAAVAQAVQIALMADTVDCPVLDELPSSVCLANQKKARHFQATSSIRVRLYRNCTGSCPHSIVLAMAQSTEAQSNEAEANGGSDAE